MVHLLSNFCFVLKNLQCGLFVYDIFWVFFTPVMVSVAKSFDAPIKVSLSVDENILCFELIFEITKFCYTSVY